MIITHFNKQHFQIKQGDLTLSFNPVSKNSKENTNKYFADVVFSTINLDDYNGGELMSYGEKTPFVVSGPGEYEIKDIFIKGFGNFINLNLKKENIILQNTSYVFTLDNIKVGFLGLINQDLEPSQKEIIEGVDILFLPVSNNNEILNPFDAHKIAIKLEPKIIIPMDYDDEALKIFLKEAGKDIKSIEKLDKLTIKKKDLENKKNEIVIFNI